MTTEVNDTVERYTISGVGPYAFSFRVFDEDEITVNAIDANLAATPLSISTHYTVSGVNDEDGGSITLTAGAATTYAGYTLDIRSDTTQYQPTNIRNQGRFLPEVHEDAFDRLSRQIQDISRKVRSSLRTPDNEITDSEAPAVASRKGRYLFANAITGAFEWVTSIATTALSQLIFNQYFFDSDANKRTSAEIAAGVTPTNLFVPNHDAVGVVYVERYGTSGNATALANARLVAKQANAVLWIRPATYSIASTFMIDMDAMKVHMERGVTISYTGADACMRFSGCSNASLTGAGNVTCTNTAAITVDLAATSSAHCLFNTAEYHVVQGAGRGATPGTLTNVGVKFGSIVAGTKICYWNKVTARRIIDVNTAYLFDAPNGSAGDGANANSVHAPMIDNVWFGGKYRAIEDFASDVQLYGSPGSGSDIVYLHHIANASFYNKITASGGEPGPLSSPFLIAVGCNYNAIDGQFSNFGLAGTDLGDGNEIRVGRELYKGAQTTGDTLTENTNYRLMKLSIANTNGGIAELRWRSRNSVQGYYSSGAARIMAYAQGGVTVERIEATFQESDQTIASQTRLIGVIVSGFDIYPIFSVRNFGGANATTNIDLTVIDAIGLEVHQAGPTVEAGALSTRAATTIQINKSVADDGTILLPNGVEGFGIVSAGAETMIFNVLATGAVVKVAGTTNTVATDTDANLCVFDGGTSATVRNRLGSTQILKITFTF